MKNANTKGMGSKASKSIVRRFTSWTSVITLAASMLFIGLLTGCTQKPDDSKGKVAEVDFAYGIDNGKIVIIGYVVKNNNLSGHLIIPDTIQGYPVIGIGSGVFKNCNGLTAVTFPASLTYIGDDAFYGCKNLTSAVFADKNGWKAGSTPISSNDLADTSKAAKYLREKTDKGGYSDKVWKKN